MSCGQLRKEEGRPPPRKLLIAGELSSKTRTSVLREALAFVEVDVVGLDQATAFLSTRICAGKA
jgi:hypothetical protein